MKTGWPYEEAHSVLLLIVSAAEHCGGVSLTAAPPVVDAVDRTTAEHSKNNGALFIA